MSADIEMLRLDDNVSLVARYYGIVLNIGKEWEKEPHNIYHINALGKDAALVRDEIIRRLECYTDNSILSE